MRREGARSLPDDAGRRRERDRRGVPPRRLRDRKSLSRQNLPDPAHGLADPLLVLDEREADESLAVGAEAAAGADGDEPLA